MPKPKTQEQLDEDNYLDLKRTEIGLRQRIERRELLNAVYEEMLALKKEGKVLAIEPAVE